MALTFVAPPTAARVLIVEDNDDLAFGLRRSLEADGHRVDVASNGAEALVQIRRATPALIILDLMMPGIDGFSVLEQLRAAGHQMPVLILSARSEEADKVRGFRAGADDFVTKPFGVRELIERVAALLRRAGYPSQHDTEGSSAAAIFDVGDVRIDVAARRVTRGTETLAFTPLELDLLLTLARNPGVALTRGRLLRDVWGHAPDIQTRTVDLHIAELRRKIEPVPSEPRHIATVFKTGYRFDP